MKGTKIASDVITDSADNIKIILFLLHKSSNSLEFPHDTEFFMETKGRQVYQNFGYSRVSYLDQEDQK